MKAATYTPATECPQPFAVFPNAYLGTQQIARAFEYDAQHRLTEIKLNGVREHGYDLNDRNQRIREYSHDTKSYMQYTYDNQGQLTFYGRRETGEFEGGSPSIYFGGYTYDMVGNRLVKMWMGGDDVIYTPNVVNQYSKITEMENSWEPGIETEFAYNPDGCQLSSTGGWSYGWNGENRLISAENGDTRLEFNYDYMGRRFEKKVYSANVLTKHEKFVYDGYKLIQVLDALNDNAVTMTFVWHPESTGLDTPFSMTYNGEIYYYVTDGNKNVTALLDADGNRAAEYIYHPFGTIYSKTGPMVDLNPFRFSSEYHDDETGLVYYNYRYYSPELGRWISRDPIEEEGGVNLYAMVGNNPVNRWDHLGFSFWDWHKRNIVDPEVRRRIAALTTVFEDRQGILIFLRWALALGDWHDAPFGNYLKHNRNLNIKLREFWSNEFIRRNTMPIGYQIISGSFYAAMENGYTTGYKLLHGVNMDEGGLEYHGILTKTAPNCFSGDFSYTWHDKIDPNFGERGDLIITPIVLGFLAYKPKDYVISINFSGQFKAKLIRGGFYDFEGYPHGNAVEDWF